MMWCSTDAARSLSETTSLIVPAYAKLSLEELSGLPEYATIKEVVSDKQIGRAHV